MAQPLAYLNPAFSAAPTTQQQGPSEALLQSLDNIKQLFATAATKNQKDHLDRELDVFYIELCKAYKTPETWTDQHREMLITLMQVKGRNLYGGAYREASLFLLTSIDQQLAAWKYGNHENLAVLMNQPSLSQLLEYLKHHPTLFNQSQIAIEDVSLIPFITSQKNSEANAKAIFHFCESLRWYGHCCQNIDSLNQLDNLHFFERVYGLCDKLLAFLIENAPKEELRKNGNWERGQLCYNIQRFLFSLKNALSAIPLSGEAYHLEEIRLLQLMLPYLELEGDTTRANVATAQIKNITALTYTRMAKTAEDPQRESYLAKAFSETQGAIEIVERTPSFDHFLKGMMYNNLAAISLNHNRYESAPMDDWIAKALEIANEKNHSYGAIFFLTAAKWELKKGNVEKAQSYLRDSLEICEKYPESTTDILDDIQSFLVSAPFFQAFALELENGLSVPAKTPEQQRFTGRFLAGLFLAAVQSAMSKNEDMRVVIAHIQKALEFCQRFDLKDIAQRAQGLIGEIQARIVK